MRCFRRARSADGNGRPARNGQRADGDGTICRPGARPLRREWLPGSFPGRQCPAGGWAVPWLEQVGDGLAEELTVDRGAEIFEFADGHQAAQERPQGAAQPDPVAGGDRGVAQDLAELLFHVLVVAAVGLSTDLNTGVIDRFRTLPMWRAAVLVGRSVADLSTAALCTLIVAVTGLVIGWRPDASNPSVIAGFALFLLFSYALSWGCGCLGIVSKGPESAQGVGLVILFPLAIVSNGLVPTQHMPTILRVIADWNPVSAVTAAARQLWGNPNPLATIHAWPMQHPVAASLLWSIALLVIFAPLATLLYRRRTTG